MSEKVANMDKEQKTERFLRGLTKGLTIFFMTIMFIYAFTLIVPILWMVVNSLKNPIDYYLSSSLSFPQDLRFQNYSEVLKVMTYKVETDAGVLEYDIFWMLYYSLVYALGTAIYSVVTITLTAYAIGRYKFWLTKLLYGIGLAWMIIPIVTDGGAGLLLRKAIGMYDNLFLTILLSGGCIFTGQFFFIMTEHFRKMGKEYAEAASIDGASEFTILFSIMIPLSVPLMMVIFVLGFVSAWNDYSIFLFMLPSYANIALGMYHFQMTAPLKGYNPPHILAGFVTVAIPIIVLYAFSQNVIAQNLTLGGLKG
jgi:ABC-type glycerol-3-phosphate transport system permease component